jgi:hypothetical protein
MEPGREDYVGGCPSYVSQDGRHHAEANSEFDSKPVSQAGCR